MTNWRPQLRNVRRPVLHFVACEWRALFAEIGELIAARIIERQPRYGVSGGERATHGRFYLTRDGAAITKRLRRFRKATWSTREGAQRAADTLNAEERAQ